mmetsp:Transcript_2503/g.8535  ORF Transcript_2503/g.8535 Transcript_2503/m.8535 type:complete len:518 (-) Transcript_2503:595-2148(-)
MLERQLAPRQVGRRHGRRVDGHRHDLVGRQHVVRHECVELYGGAVGGGCRCLHCHVAGVDAEAASDGSLERRDVRVGVERRIRPARELLLAEADERDAQRERRVCARRRRDARACHVGRQLDRHARSPVVASDVEVVRPRVDGLAQHDVLAHHQERQRQARRRRVDERQRHRDRRVRRVAAERLHRRDRHGALDAAAGVGVRLPLHHQPVDDARVQDGVPEEPDAANVAARRIVAAQAVEVASADALAVRGARRALGAAAAWAAVVAAAVDAGLAVVLHAVAARPIRLQADFRHHVGVDQRHLVVAQRAVVAHGLVHVDVLVAERHAPFRDSRVVQGGAVRGGAVNSHVHAVHESRVRPRASRIGGARDEAKHIPVASHQRLRRDHFRVAVLPLGRRPARQAELKLLRVRRAVHGGSRADRHAAVLLGRASAGITRVAAGIFSRVEAREAAVGRRVNHIARTVGGDHRAPARRGVGVRAALVARALRHRADERRVSVHPDHVNLLDAVGASQRVPAV